MCCVIDWHEKVGHVLCYCVAWKGETGGQVFFKLLLPNINYSGRNAPLTSEFHFIYLLNKYIYRIF